MCIRDRAYGDGKVRIEDFGLFDDSDRPSNMLMKKNPFKIKLKVRFLKDVEHQMCIRDRAKLVRAVKGSVFDVAVDLRSDSKTYGKWFGVELTEENKKQFLIPVSYTHLDVYKRQA